MGSYIKDTRTQLVICNIRHATASSVVGVSVRTVPGLKKNVTVSKQDVTNYFYQLPAKRDQILVNITKLLVLVKFYHLTRKLS